MSYYWSASSTIGVSDEFLQSFRELCKKRESAKKAYEQAESERRAAEERVDTARHEFSEINRDLDNNRGEIAKALLRAWFLKNLDGKSEREKQQFADSISLSLSTYEGRTQFYHKVAAEICDSNPLFKDISDTPSDEIKQVFRTVAANVFNAVSPIWRESIDRHRRDYYDRRRELERLAAQHHPRYITNAVFHHLRDRLKKTHFDWWQETGCCWSFRNQSTIDADIAKALEKVELDGEICSAYPWAA